MKKTALLAVIAILVLATGAYWYFSDAHLNGDRVTSAAPPSLEQREEAKSDDSPKPSPGRDDVIADSQAPTAPPTADAEVPPAPEALSEAPAAIDAAPAPVPAPPPPPPPPRKARGESAAPPNTQPSQADATEDMPIFPYPVPKASATQVLPRNILVGTASEPTFGTVAEKLVRALDRAGYGESSYYALAGGHGIAIATKLEQINDDGSPKIGEARFQQELAPITEFSLTSYLKALFTARSGRFRVIVFALSGGVRQDSIAPNAARASEWAGGGQTHLPARFASIRFTDDMTCTALIYEFEKLDYSADAKFIDPGKMNAMAHLIKAGIWSLIAR